MADSVETAIYRLRVEGQDQIDKLKTSIDGLVVSEEKATAANRTTSDEINKRLARYDPLIKAQQAYRKELEYIAKAQEAGVGTQKEIDALFQGATGRYQAAQKAISGLGEAHKGLDAAGQSAFHSLRSVFEQIALGQSPLTALIGQINHLSYAASAEGGLAGAFKGVGGTIATMATGAMEFITPANLAIGAIVGIGTAIVATAAQFATAQKDIERSLIGIGGQSGATAAGINRFAAGGSLTGLSIGERQQAGMTFAKGGVDVDKLRGVEDAIRGYATLTGTDAVKATEALSRALADGAEGVKELEKVYGALNPALTENVRQMLAVNDTAGAQQAMLDAIAAANTRALGTVSNLTDAYNGLVNTLGHVAEGWLLILSYKVFETADQQAAAAQKIAAAQAAVAETQANLVQRKGQAVIEDVEPQIAQLRKLEQQLVDLRAAKAAVGATPLIDQGAEAELRKHIESLKAATSETARLATETAAQSGRNVAALGSAATAAEQAQARIDALTASFQKEEISANTYSRAIQRVRDEYEKTIPVTEAMIAAQRTLADLMEKDITRQTAGFSRELSGTVISARELSDNIGDADRATANLSTQTATLGDNMAGAASSAWSFANAISTGVHVATADWTKQFPGLATMSGDYSYLSGEPGGIWAGAQQGANDAAVKAGSAYRMSSFDTGVAASTLPLSMMDQVQRTMSGQAGGLGWAPAGFGLEGLQGSIDQQNLAASQKKADDIKNSMDNLAKSTDSLNATNQELLSPYYTQDPRTSHIGFRSQGMALGGYVDVPGSPSSNDNMMAMIPVASGERIYVDPMTGRRSSVSGGAPINIATTNNFYGNVDKDSFGRTLYQANQQLAKQIRSATG